MKKSLLVLSLAFLLLNGCATSVDTITEEPTTTPTPDNTEWIAMTIASGAKEGLEMTEWDTPVPCQEGVAASSLTDVLPEQITRCFSIADLTIAFVSQPNAWTALTETRAWEAEGNTAWSGLLAKPIKGEWEVLYKIPDEDFNPVNLILEGEQLILDAADDSGAGSGEGTLQRYVYPTAGVVDELLNTWQKVKCTGYYVPETYKYEAFSCM